MKISIYARVSTDKQELDNQLRDLKQYAKRQGWQVVKEYTDIVTGKETREQFRPGFNELFGDAHKRLFDLVLFWDLSRFSRAGTWYTLKKLRELESYGVDWHSYQDKYLSSLGDFKDVVISIMATLAKIEREKISERTKAGLRRVKASGRRLGKPALSEKVKQQIRELREQGKNYREICQEVYYWDASRNKHQVSLGFVHKTLSEQSTR